MIPALATLLVPAFAQVSLSISPATERTKVLADWEALGYGMFIHFGMSTFTGDELAKEPAPASAYAPTALDPDQWIRVARDAGMKYAVLTTKHCAGHCLWDSGYTDYDVSASPEKTDVVERFVAACRKHGVKPGFYYLLGWDGHHQAAKGPKEYEGFCAWQLEELLTRYGPIVELWLDIPWDMGEDTAAVLARLYGKAKALQPECLVLMNQGFSDGVAVAAHHPSFAGNPTGKPPVAIFPRDLINGERTLPPAGGHDPKISFGGRTYYIPMEVCDTLAHDWFWMPEDSLKSVRTLHRLYQDCRSRKANLLLDVAPDRTGKIPEESVRRLMELRAALDDPSRLPVPLPVKAATASNVYHGESKWSAEKAVDDDSNTRWATDDEVRDCTLTVDLGEPRRIGSAYLCEGWGRVRLFVLERKEDSGEWRSFHRGRTIGNGGVTLTFPPITAQEVRLRILEATLGPTIWDFHLFAAGETDSRPGGR